MKKLKNLKKYSLLFLVILVFIGCKNSEKEDFTSRVNELPYYNEESFTPKWIASNSKKLKSFHKIPDFSLINQNGENITQKTFENKIYVTDFFFTTCPGICPMMTKNMNLVQEAFKNDDTILMLSYSVTPIKDSVKLVESNGVYDFGLQVAENKNIIPNADFSGAVIGSSLSAVSYSQYFTDAGKDTNGVSVVDGTVPLGLTTRALKIDALFGQRINNFTGTNGTSTILTNGDAFSCGIWVYNSDWSTYVSNGGYTIFNIRRKSVS